MDYGKILKRSWEILMEYRVLWIFGIILAILTASSGSNFQYTLNRDDFSPGREITMPDDAWEELKDRDWDGFIEELQSKGVPDVSAGVVIGIVSGIVLMALLVGIVTTIVRYVAETALVRMVDAYEDSGEKLGFRQGWRMGWSRSAWRFFMIDLLFGLLVAVAIVVPILVALLPLLLWNKGETAGIFGTVTTIGLTFLIVFFAIILATLVRLFKHFFKRTCALEEARVGTSIRRGFAMVKQNLVSVGLMWLILAGINIGWNLVMWPVGALVGLVALIIGGGAGGLVFLIARLVIGLGGAIAIAVSVGVLIFIVLFAVPTGFLAGLREVYISSTWTLSYRDLRALKSLDQEDAPREIEVRYEPEIP